MQELNDKTKKVLVYKALDKTLDAEIVEWAVDMLVAGYDSKYLRILAGETPPFNQFYMHSLLEKVLSELKFSIVDKSKLVREYAYALAKQISDDLSNDLEKDLDSLRGLYIETASPPELAIFYNLYFAKTSLQDYGYQYYLQGDITISNIDNVIRKYCSKWIAEHAEFA